MVQDSRNAEIIEVSDVPLWFRAIQVATLGVVLGLVMTIGVVYYNYRQAESVTDIFRQSRRPILQYRLERGVWPRDFSFDKAPADLESYDFSTAVQKVRELDIRGVWQFTSEVSDGKAVPKVVFKPDDGSLNTHRILCAVDAQLDDGKENDGRLLVKGAQAEFTLMAE